MIEEHSEVSGNTYAIFIPTLNPEEPVFFSKCVLFLIFL